MDPATIIYIVTFVLTILLAPKPPQPKPATLSDFDIPTAESNRSIPVVFGTVTITGSNTVWYGDLRTVAVKKSGGKW